MEEDVRIDRILDHRLGVPTPFANDSRSRRAHAYEPADESLGSLDLLSWLPF
jgi:hypothetical protein